MKSTTVNLVLRFYNVSCMLLFMAMFILPANAQHRLRLVVTNESALHQEETIFVAGNINKWDPRMDSFQLKMKNNEWILDIANLAPASYSFKFTRGTWTKVECSKSGNDIENRILTLSSDTTLYYTIEAWKDDFVVIEKKHTSTENVSLLDTAFYMPQLNRSRRVVIYLPEGYGKTAKRYPVLYMQDGQNLFDEYSTNFGEWGIDECLDSLIKKQKTACIVVAIDNGPNRLTEYNPFYFEKFGEGEGDFYVRFLVETLKPFIDKKYKTLPGKENTIIAGSSMGGLISFYAKIKYPNVFGKAGVFSPAFWTADSIKIITDSLGRKVNGKLFFYMGGLEGGNNIDKMVEISQQLAALSTATIYIAVDEKGNHNEQAWRKWFAEFYLWITADGNNYIIRTWD